MREFCFLGDVVVCYPVFLQFIFIDFVGNLRPWGSVCDIYIRDLVPEFFDLPICRRSTRGGLFFHLVKVLFLLYPTLFEIHFEVSVHTLILL